MPRLTQKVRQQILDQNEGFTTRTYFENRNFREERIYTVRGGCLYVREIGDTSQSDSAYDQERRLDDDETHRFLCEHSWKMNLDGIE